jgi:hypothetical protein
MQISCFGEVNPRRTAQHDSTSEVWIMQIHKEKAGEHPKFRGFQMRQVSLLVNDSFALASDMECL